MVKKFLILSCLCSGLFFFSAWTAKETTILKKSSLPLPPHAEAFEKVRIALAQKVSEIHVSALDNYEVVNHEGRLLLGGTNMSRTAVRASSGQGIQWGPQSFQESSLIISSRGDGIRIGAHVYRDGIRISREPNSTLTVINEIPMDEYLKGVLPVEANPVWNPEALKAQAIVSRTYALFKTIENKDLPFDLSKDVLSQVYAGKHSEKSETNQAIQATSGEILVYDGKIFPAYFHSTCGGRTTRPEYQWNYEGHPVLKGVACQFCRESKHYRWEASFSLSEIAQKLKKQGFSMSKIYRISSAHVDDSGRVSRFLIEHDRGNTELRANDFRLWVNPQKLKSTLITDISQEGNQIIFQGRGWGHGVGLCQYGMKKLAELGYTYKEIIQFYYPGAEIIRLRSGSLMPPEGEKVSLGEKIKSLFSFFE